jgi:hypothetical protein
MWSAILFYCVRLLLRFCLHQKPHPPVIYPEFRWRKLWQRLIVRIRRRDASWRGSCIRNVRFDVCHDCRCRSWCVSSEVREAEWSALPWRAEGSLWLGNRSPMPILGSLNMNPVRKLENTCTASSNHFTSAKAHHLSSTYTRTMAQVGVVTDKFLISSL